MDREQALINLRDKVEAGGISINFIDGAIDTSLWRSIRGAFFGSLDAARVLHCSVLPDEGWEVWRTGKYPGMIPGSSRHEFAARVGWGTHYLGAADNPARAHLIAILNALIAQEASKTPHRETGRS